MSVRHQSQDQAGSTCIPAGDGHLRLHRAVVASTSLLAIAAALGWSNPALAAGTCGAPAGGVANCNATSYPAGIEYAGADAVDDLTVNVGTFAGQSAAVTVDGSGIIVESTLFTSPTTSETVNVGDNVSISSAVSTGITAVSTAYQAAYTGAQATASSTVTNQGRIATTGGYEEGIYAGAVAQSVAGYFYSATSGAYSTASNTGTISTTGIQASGIDAFAAATAGLAGGAAGAYYGAANAVAVVNNSGNITTTGASSGAFGADGIYASAYSVADGLDGSRGTATANVTNSGTISTSGDLAIGIQANAEGIGESYAGFATGGAYASVTNSGNINTKGDGAAGISATTLAIGNSDGKAYGYSEAKVVNSGSISTAGTGSSGVSVKATGASYGYYASVYTLASVTNAGAITTTGDGSMGIYALAGSHASGLLSAPYANTNIVNTGNIKTTGAGSVGILGISSTSAPGVFIYSAARTTITNAGSVSTSGDGAAGIYGLAQSTAASYTGIASDSNGKTYAGSTLTNVGSVTTQGIGAAGAVAISKATSYSAYYSHANAVTAAVNTGTIETAGAGAYGLVAQSTATAVTPASSIYQSIGIASTAVTNAGTITVSGAGANGVVATSGATAVGTTAGASASATTMVTNAGKITATGIGIEAYAGAYASSTSGAVAKATSTVANAGSVTSTGAGGTGVLVASVGATNAGAVATSSTLVNTATGSIVASGAGGVGAKVEGAYSTLVTYAGSTISGGTGAGAVGVYMNGAENIVSNGGTIGSANDAALSMTGLYANIVKNTGTITGTVTLHSGAGGQNVLYNYGTWNAVGGDSDFTHGAGGGSNLVNESGGTIVVVGSQSFTNLDKFTNIGTVDMTQAGSANLGARPAFETLTVSGDYEGIGGILKVDASTQGGMQGDELVIQGAASGSTKVKPTIVGTPGATTGNGILLVSAASGTASNEFTLSGNASNGSEVAGAFEYNLAFVPGTGTAGDWYLQSQVYPGTYQFGQVQSSTLLIADQANPDLRDLMNQTFSGMVKGASLADTSQQVASADSSFVPAPNGAGGLSGWGRFDETRFNVDPAGGSSAADYKLRVDASQFGIDDSWHNADNFVLVGGYITPFHAFSDFSSFGGHIGTTGTAYGLYGLWFSGPWQAGIRLNYDDNSAHISDTFLGTNATVKSNEEGIQAIASYDIALDWADFTPSGEFNYGKVDGVHFTDGVGDLVQVGSTNDVWGKLNGRFSWDVTTDHGLLVQPYVNIGLLYRGDTDTGTRIDTFSASTNVNGIDGDVGFGVNTNLAANLSLSAQGDYLAGNRVKGWTGFVGLRYYPGAVEAPPPASAPPMVPPPPPPPPAPMKTFIVFFDFNKSNLTAEAQSVVSEAVKTAQSSGMVRVLVTGHTDTVGSDSYNMGLSVRRAQSVKDEMVREGIEGSGISIEGKGFHDPLVPTGPGVREPQNRRAVIDLGG